MSQRRKRRQSRSLPVFPIAIAAVIVLGIVAIALSRGGGDGTPTGTPVTAPVEVTGEPLGPYSEGDDPAIGEPIPAVEGETLDGDPISITPDGPKAIVFLAHWCPHCQEEVRQLSPWLGSDGQPDGAELISVATAIDPSRPNYPPSDWFEREGWTAPVLVDDEASSVSDAFGLSAFPFWVFVDEDGNVAGRRTGVLGADNLESILAELAGGGS